MQHWKDAEVMQILRPLFGGRECIVRVDDRTQTIVIMHLPKRLLDMDAAQGKRLKKLKNLEGELEKAKAHAQETHDQSRRTYSDRDRIRDVNAGAEVRNVTNRIRELQEESSKAELFLSTLREVLIMDTGREISGKAVWEFGQTFSLGKF